MSSSFHIKPRRAGPASGKQVRALKQDPHAIQELRRRFAFDPPGLPGGRMGDEQMLRAQRRHVREWHRGNAKRRVAVVPVGHPKGEEAGPAAAPEERMRESEKTFFAIEAVDGRGDAVPNLKYKVKLPDGSTREGKLDDKGTAKLSGVDPGMCELSFPELHGTDWTMS